MSQIVDKVLRGSCLLLSAVTLLLIVQCSPKTHGNEMKQSKTIEIWLGGSIEKVRGEKWLRLKGGEPSDLDGFDDPRTFILHFPRGRRIDVWSKGTSMAQEGGVVTQVMLMPLDRVLDFHQAVEALSQILHRFNLDHNPRLQERIAKWRTETPRKDTFTATYAGATDIEPGYELFVEIKPQGEQSDQGWYVVLNFEKILR